MSDVTKLPKWAQEHIRTLSRERDEAIAALNEFTDEQTPAAMFVEEMVSTGEGKGPSTKRRYISGHRLSIIHQGIALDVFLSNGDPQSLAGINLSWRKDDRAIGAVAMIPTSYQSVAIVPKEQLD